MVRSAGSRVLRRLRERSSAARAWDLSTRCAPWRLASAMRREHGNPSSRKDAEPTNAFAQEAKGRMRGWKLGLICGDARGLRHRWRLRRPTSPYLAGIKGLKQFVVRPNLRWVDPDCRGGEMLTGRQNENKRGSGRAIHVLSGRSSRSLARRARMRFP